MPPKMKIPGGYILTARKLIDSDLMDKPPLWSKLWSWMLCKARHFEGQGFKVGEFFTTIEEMREAMSWHVGYRKEMPSAKEIRRAYEGFTKGMMTGTTKGTRGIRITILNFEYYQNPKNYEGHGEGHNENLRRSSEGAHYKQEEKKVIREEAKASSCPEVKIDLQTAGENLPALASPHFISLPLNNGAEHHVLEADVAEYASLYLAADVEQELRNMRGWLLADSKRRKTAGGIKRFIASWLSKAHDKPNPASRTRAPDPSRLMPTTYAQAQDAERRTIAQKTRELQEKVNANQIADTPGSDGPGAWEALGGLSAGPAHGGGNRPLDGNVAGGLRPLGPADIPGGDHAAPQTIQVFPLLGRDTGGSQGGYCPAGGNCGGSTDG